MRYVTCLPCMPSSLMRFGQKNDDYDEDEGMYDELNLDEEEEKFGRLITEEHDSDASDDASECVFSCIHLACS
jgi:hypothetical protein